jgi:hypothetical protein
MLVATFAPSSEWAGTCVTCEGKSFMVEGRGPTTAAALMGYDRKGELVWATDGTRAWVGSLTPQSAGDTPSSPPEANAAMQRCATCGSEVAGGSVACPTCGTPVSAFPASPVPPPPAPALLACPVCQHEVSSQAGGCPNCGHPLPTPAAHAAVFAPTLSATDETARRAAGGGWVALIGGVLMVAGSLLPWTHAQIFAAIVDRNGMQLGANTSFSVAGLVTLLLGIVTCLIGLSTIVRFEMPPFVQRSPIITGIVAASVVLLNIGAMQHYVQTVRAASTATVASLGFGLWLLFLGCALAIIGGLVLRTTRQASP